MPAGMSGTRMTAQTSGCIVSRGMTGDDERYMSPASKARRCSLLFSPPVVCRPIRIRLLRPRDRGRSLVLSSCLAFESDQQRQKKSFNVGEIQSMPRRPQLMTV